MGRYQTNGKAQDEPIHWLVCIPLNLNVSTVWRKYCRLVQLSIYDMIYILT